MIDINLIRENADLVKENIKKKFQDEKLPLVDEIKEMDERYRNAKFKADELRCEKNKVSAKIGEYVRNKEFDKVEETKKRVNEINTEIANLTVEEERLQSFVHDKMLLIPNIIDPSVPIGKDDPYHADIMERLNGLDKESAGRTSGEGFYYLTGDIARIHSAMLSYARDFMIDKGFTYCIPPFMIHASVVEGVMSFPEMEAMMYKIEGEDLYLIGTSEHSMIGRFLGQIVDEKSLPIALTSYSPCFRKEGGAHGLEEKGVYRVHQFEKQKMWKATVELFRSLDIPVRQLECCSGDLADLKVKSCDIEAWSPRQQKYFEVGSCSNLSDAQARRLQIRTKGENGTYYVHTLNNTVLASPRALIAFVENNYNEDGSISIPEVLRPYMGGKTKIEPTK